MVEPVIVGSTPVNNVAAAARASAAAVFGQPVHIKFESGQAGSVTLRQFKVGEYAKLMGLMANEVRLIEIAADLPEGQLTRDHDPISPDSYDELATVVRENNRRFFAYCARQMSLMGQMPDKMINRVTDRALASGN